MFIYIYIYIRILYIYTHIFLLKELITIANRAVPPVIAKLETKK